MTRRLVDSHLESLSEMVLRMGGQSERILAKAWQSLTERRLELTAEVKEDDLEIDELELAIDEAVLKVLALQAPVAEDLRRVITIKTMATDLERVGDLARNIAKSAARMIETSEIPIPPDLGKLADDSLRLLRRALDSFSDLDVASARQVLADDDAIDASEGRIIAAAVEKIASNPELSRQEVELILIAKSLERVADHATNIAEDVVMLAEAENIKHAEKLAAKKRGAG